MNVGTFGLKLGLVGAVLLMFFGAASAAEQKAGDSAMDSVKLDHLALWVSDLDRSTRFYRDGLGFRPIGDGAEIATPDVASLLGRDHEVKLRLRRFERDGVGLTLVQYVSPKEVNAGVRAIANQPGAAAMSFYVKDLDKMVAEATKAGGRREGAITMAVGRIVTFSDPDGFIVEFNERP